MKTYVLIISRTFPATHPHKGEDTNFVKNIFTRIKIHTIRANYELWEKRIEEVQAGEAELSLRYWQGKPYNSKQYEFCRLKTYHGVGIQKVEFKADEFGPLVNGRKQFMSDLAANDGLSLTDFTAWFKGYDLSKAMAIIHFTKFRYS